MMLFLSHSSVDSEQAREVAGYLRDAGFNVWLDLDSIPPGAAWMQAIEDAIEASDAFLVCVGANGIQRFVDFEVRTAIVRKAENPDYQLIPIPGSEAEPSDLPAFLRQFQCLKLLNNADVVPRLEKLLVCFTKQPNQSRSYLEEGQSPFLGLDAFDGTHAELFFGRDSEIHDLLSAMRRDNFLAIVGDSGSGKSSLIMAGLIPALHWGRYRKDARQHPWRVMTLKPGSAPFDALAWCLAELNPHLDPSQRVGLPARFREALSQGSQGLLDCIGGVTEPRENILIVVDQFEELFTLTPSNSRLAFIEALLAAVDTKVRNDIHVIVTLRADFYSRCWEHPELPKRIAKNQFAAQRMASEKLHEVITKPLAVAGAKVDEGLVETLLHDVGDEPGNLPLLEFTLFLLWNRQCNGRLTFEDYRAIGRLRGALGTYADSVFNELNVKEQSLVRKIFLELTHISDGCEETRRRIARSEICSLKAKDVDANQVVDLLIRKRLVTASLESTDCDPLPSDMLEVSHEALIREWRQLRQWIDESRESLRIKRKFSDAEADWRNHGKPQSFLYPGERLAEIEDWAKNNSDDVTARLELYLSESIAERDRRAKEALVAKRRIERLTDEKTLRDLAEEAESLWPAVPSMVASYEKWLNKARELLSRKDEHRRLLKEAVEAQGVIVDEAGTEAWWRDALEDLVRELEEFEDPERGLVAGIHPFLGLGIERRLAFARTVATLTIDSRSSRRAWDQAMVSIADVANSPMYHGLKLQPQLGLVPIGKDPISGLWEFAHLQTGAIPARDRKNGRLLVTDDSGIVFVLIPGGVFLMGAQANSPTEPNYDPHGGRSDELEAPIHRVTLCPFFLSKYEMTQGQWQRFTGRNPSHWSPQYRPGQVTLCNPVEQVTWDDCERILRRLGFVLPTEVQWEYACRAGTQSIFWFGGLDTDVLKYGNINTDNAAEAQKFRQAPTGDMGTYHTPVDRFPPNPFGLHDMHGNVWEWCMDGVGDYSAQTRLDDGLRMSRDDSRRCLRGGSFVNAVSDAGASRRLFRPTDYPNYDLGVRPAKQILGA